MSKFARTVTSESHDYLWSNLGLAWKSHVSDIMAILNREHVRHHSDGFIANYERFHGSPYVDLDVIEWLQGLFDAHGIDRNQFLRDIVAVANMTHPKMNAFVVQGPTNCFKSNIFRLIFDSFNITPMTRSSNNNHFWLQGCLNQQYALYEEPTITPQDVND